MKTANNSRKQDRAAAFRFSRLRQAGVPAIITSSEAWYLSGGVLGDRMEERATIPLATVAQMVPDCEAFLPDWAALHGA